MVEFNYSAKALEILHRFHRKDVIFFVEEEDDRMFWYYILKSLGRTENIHIKIAGCKLELEKMIKTISEHKEKIPIIICCDNDYSETLNQNSHFIWVVNTYGYSIENTLYCSKTISKLIVKYSRSIKNFEKNIELWKKQFCKNSKNFLFYDLANEKYNKGKKVMGDCCARFLYSNSSCNLSKDKINAYINTIKNDFTIKEISECKIIIKNDKRNLFMIIRGHFLTTAVMNFIKLLVKNESKNKIRLTHDNLFAETVDNCVNCTHKSICADILTLSERIDLAINSLQN